MLGHSLDRLISVFSPRWGLDRIAARATLEQISQLAGGQGGYAAGKLNRLTKYRLGTKLKEHAIPADEIANLRSSAWDLWRNNPYARKIVRSILSQVIGRGLRPASSATRADGAPHVEFRARADRLWQELQRGFDFRGLPGRGGLSMTGLQRLALASVVVSGEVLAQPRPLSDAERDKRDLPIPLSALLIDADRLNPDLTRYPAAGENQVYRGIELDAEGRRVAYHLSRYPIGDAQPSAVETTRIPAAKILHVYVEDDVDQYRGVSWFAPSLLQMRDTGDYQYNELKASAMAACIVLGYTKPTGRSKFGLHQSADQETEDENGNAVSAIQPGMLIDIGKDGRLQGFNPARPGANAEAFIQHMLRGTAAAFPGVKASTVTGDYRNSSFSSERSADNDCWPELEHVQDWFAGSFCQPLWEEILDAAVVAGYFEGVVGVEEFAARRKNFTAAAWQGPVARSINPVDDATSAGLRIARGLSSPQIEAAAVGKNWQNILRDIAEFYDFAESLGLPPEVVNNVLSVDAQDEIAGGSTAPSAESEPPMLPEEEDDDDETPAPDMEAADEPATAAA